MSLLKESQHLRLPLELIESGTQNFQVCIGKGGFGTVYKGQLSISGKPTTVAVKRLNEKFGQGLKEFLTEIQLLTGQTHPNLISLVGYCDEGKEKIIVYEYAEHGSLDQYLRRSSSSSSNLTWLEKLKICVGAARGLDYLHNHVGQHQTVIHRDIKSSNILIDENWVAKISDLGLSKLSLSGLNRSAVISHACGTPGYIEPEYMYTGIVKKESDVYSFGMVLFEVLCGRLCTIRDDDGFLLSGPLAKDYFENNKLDEIVDPSLKEQMSPDSMKKFSAIAYTCLHYDRQQRPSMDLVLKKLEESLEIQFLYTSEASCPMEDPYKSSGELEAYVNMKSAIASSEPPVIMSLKEDQVHTSTESNLHEVANRSSVDLTMQSHHKNEINVRVIDGRPTSLHTLLEGTGSLMDMNKEVVKIILDSKKHNWKHMHMSELVEEYFEDSQQTFDFCDALERCLKKVQDIRLLTCVALNHFEERIYVKTLEDLKSLKAIQDPFNEDFFKIFQSRYNFVYNRQKELYEKLQRNKQKLDKKFKNIQIWRMWCNVIILVTFVAALISGGVAGVMAAPAVAIVVPLAAIIPLALAGKWMNSFSRNYRNVTKREREVVSSMQVGGFIGIRDLDVINVLVEKVIMDVNILIKNAEHTVSAIEGYKEEMVKRRIEEMKKKLDSFVNNVEILETHADTYVRDIRRARAVILQRIIK